jgi:hypothetical protein
MHPNRHGLPNNISFWNLTPHPAIARVVAIIAHHKVMASFYRGRKIS